MIVNCNWFLAVIGWFAPIKPIAITLFPFIIKRRDVSEYGRTMTHEKIHLAQYKELWFFGFLFLYFKDYLKARKVYDKTKSYKRIRFEQEAYAEQGDEHYLLSRKRNAWKSYTVLEAQNDTQLK